MAEVDWLTEPTADGRTLRDYQRAAITHLQTNPQAGLMLDMGLGKTASVLRALRPEHLPALVVAPKRVAETVWHIEAADWRPDLRVGLAVGPPARRAKVLADRSYDVVVMGRDNLFGHAEGLCRARDWSTLVVDELTGFKTKKSKRWRAARKIITHGDVTHVWGLTGTPSPNGLMDLWGQMYLLDSGKRLGKTLTAYRNAYFSPGRRLPTGVVIRWDLAVQPETIYRKIDDICMSMATDETRVKLPPVTWNTITVEMPGTVRKTYDAFKQDFVIDMEDAGLGEYVHTAPTAAIMANKLSQFTAGFVYTDETTKDRTDLHDAKTNAVLEIIEGTGSPVLVFYNFTAERERLLTALRSSGVGVRDITSSGAIEDWNAGKVPVMLAHPAGAGHGLNLQHGGHTVIWTTPTNNLEYWEQANKRLARSGQTNPVVVHMIEVPDTVDATIYAALRRKARVQDALLDHLEAVV